MARGPFQHVAMAFRPVLTITCASTTVLHVILVRLLELCIGYLPLVAIFLFLMLQNRNVSIIGSRRLTCYAPITNCTFVVGGSNVEFVPQYSHLGHIINSIGNDDDDDDDDDDIYNRRLKFIA